MKTLDNSKLDYCDPEYDQFYKQLHELIDPEISAWSTLNGFDCEFGNNTNPAHITFIAQIDVDTKLMQDLFDKWATKLAEGKE